MLFLPLIRLSLCSSMFYSLYTVFVCCMTHDTLIIHLCVVVGSVTMSVFLPVHMLPYLLMSRALHLSHFPDVQPAVTLGVQ